MANRHHLAWLKVLAALLACGNLLVLNLAAQDASAPPDRSPITIYVTASHKNGSPANVTTSDLAATLDKQPVQITAVTPAQDEPLLFAMVVDISGSDAEQKQSIRKAALEIFQALSKSGNQGYLTLFNEEVAISGAPITPERAESNLEKVFFHGGTALYDKSEFSSAANGRCLRWRR